MYSNREQLEITQLLEKVSDGDREAYDELYPLVYEKLRNLAQNQLNREYTKKTLCKTELVHEVYEKMVDQKHVDYRDRAHFYAIAARSMRQILVDHARKKGAQKAGSAFARLQIDVAELHADEHSERILALNELLEKLRETDERLCRVVEFRFFIGLSIEETSKLLDTSPATVNRDWLKAKVWFYKHMKDDNS